MSRLLEIMKYESMLDVIPGSVRTIRDLFSSKPSVPTAEDSADMVRFSVRGVLTYREITDIVNAFVANPQSANPDQYQIQTWLALVTTLVVYEAGKYLVDLGIKEIGKASRNYSAGHKDTI